MLKPRSEVATTLVSLDAEVARYIAEMAAALCQLAGRPRFRTLRYLLDMARLEAEREADALRETGPTQPSDMRRG